jgi:hypothetical protein
MMAFHRNALQTALRYHSAFVRALPPMDLDLDILPEHMPLRAIPRQPINGRERIRRNRRAKPLDHVPVIIIVRRLNEDEAKTLGRASGWGQGRHLVLNIATIHKQAEPESKLSPTDPNVAPLETRRQT